MGGLDSETARALGIAGVVATIVASLVALVSNQLAAHIARGTARDVARIQSETQLLVDRRKVLRDHRAQRLGGFLEYTAHRFGGWQDVFVAACEEDRDEVARCALRVFENDVARDLAHEERVARHEPATPADYVLSGLRLQIGQHVGS